MIVKIVFTLLFFVQISFAIDSLIEDALRCIEKRKLEVFSVEKINGKIYINGEFETDSLIVDNCYLRFQNHTSIFEYKKKCHVRKIRLSNETSYSHKKGLIDARLTLFRDSIVVRESDSVLWSCPMEKNVPHIEILNKHKLMIYDDQGIWLLDNKCRKTIFEQESQLSMPYNVSSKTRFISYYLPKQKNPYIVLFDSSFEKYWGTVSSFHIDASVHNVACGYDLDENPDDTSQNKWLVKCVEWTGNAFFEKIISDNVNVSDDQCPVAERLFPCDEGICSQDFKTKKIKVLIEE